MRDFTLTVNGKEYRAAALPLGALRRFTREGTFEKLAHATSPDPAKLVEALDAIVRIVSAALLPANPECTEEWCADHVPCGPQGAALLATVLRASGLISEEGDGGGNATSPSV